MEAFYLELGFGVSMLVWCLLEYKNLNNKH